MLYLIPWPRKIDLQPTFRGFLLPGVKTHAGLYFYMRFLARIFPAFS